MREISRGAPGVVGSSPAAPTTETTGNDSGNPPDTEQKGVEVPPTLHLTLPQNCGKPDADELLSARFLASRDAWCAVTGVPLEAIAPALAARELAWHELEARGDLDFAAIRELEHLSCVCLCEFFEFATWLEMLVPAGLISEADARAHGFRLRAHSEKVWRDVARVCDRMGARREIEAALSVHTDTAAALARACIAAKRGAGNGVGECVCPACSPKAVN